MYAITPWNVRDRIGFFQGRSGIMYVLFLGNFFSLKGQTQNARGR